jgi:hypothetical protein
MYFSVKGSGLLEVERQRLVDQQVVVAGAVGGLAGRHQAAHRQAEAQHEGRLEHVAVLHVGEVGLGCALRRRHHPRMGDHLRLRGRGGNAA